MARIGKIARLPRDIRSQLNTRLQDGGEGKQILLWLNSLPEVIKVLAECFEARPINDQNLSDWRKGGYEEWLAHQDVLAHAANLAAHQHELETVAPGQSPTGHLAAAITFRYAAILAAQGNELDDKALVQLKSLGRTCQAVLKLRRDDENTARLKIETERWELDRLTRLDENAEALKRRQKEALAAPVWAALRMGERARQFGASAEVLLGLEYLREIESCPDPAHFKSRIMTPENLPHWERYAAEMARNTPPKLTPMQEAAQMLREADIALGVQPEGSHPRRKRTHPARSTSTRRRSRGPSNGHAEVSPEQAQEAPPSAQPPTPRAPTPPPPTASGNIAPTPAEPTPPSTRSTSSITSTPPTPPGESPGSFKPVQG